MKYNIQQTPTIQSKKQRKGLVVIDKNSICDAMMHLREEADVAYPYNGFFCGLSAPYGISDDGRALYPANEIGV